VRMVLDPEVDAAYPKRWIGKITVRTNDGRVLHGRVDEPKGDPGNTLTRPELEAKARSLAAYAGGASDDEMTAVMARIWAMTDWSRVDALLPRTSSPMPAPWSSQLLSQLPSQLPSQLQSQHPSHQTAQVSS
jgi:2-methylcitrate dehydratase PrpD